MSYRYEDIPDKSKEGMDKELEIGLAKMAVYFYQTYGLPLEIFKEEMDKKTSNKAEQWLTYLNFRNSNPKIYENK